VPVNDSLASDQWQRFRWCLERGHYDFLQTAQRSDSYIVGDQWEQSDLNKLKLQGRPALTINKILPTLMNIFGEQIQNRAEVIFRPSSGGSADVADALTKVWMQIAQNNQLQWTRSEVFADGCIRGRGFYDVRLDFNDALEGEVRISQLNSKNVIVDPDAEEYDPDSWADVFVSKWMTWQDIAVLYNEEDADYLKDKESSSFPYAYDSIERLRDRFAGPALQGSYYGELDQSGVRRNIRVVERQHRMLDRQKHFVDRTTGDTRPIPDGWDRNRIAAVIEKTGGQLDVMKKQIKRIRWTVTADHVVLHDDWSPYQHMTVVPFFPFFRHGRTVGLVENLISSQELLNKTSSQELHIINTTANSGWKLKTGALKNMSVEELKVSGSQTGLVLELDDVNSAEKITPNATPNGLDRISYKAEEHIKSISGVSDSMQGFDREDVAAKAIGYKQQRGQVNLAKVMDNLERTDWLLARNVLDCVQEYYTEPRLLEITHDDLQNSNEQVQVNQPGPEGEILNDLTLGEYQIVITSAPARATIEDSQFEQAVALRSLPTPVMIPDSVLVENSRLARRAEIIKQMEAAQNSPQAQQQQQLALRGQAAEVSKTEAEAQKKHADTQLQSARAQAETQDLQNGGGDGAAMAKLKLEEQQQIREDALAHRRMDEEFALKREDSERMFALKREQLAQELELKRQEADQATAQKAEEAAQAHYAERTTQNREQGTSDPDDNP
jgi:hypothetical protein